MNICFLAPGSSIHTVRWVNAMVEKGHQVSLVTMHPPNDANIDVDVKIYKLKFNAPFGYYLNISKVNKLLKKINPDIVNAHFASGYGTLARLVKFKPTLLSVWGSDVFEFPYESNIKRKIIQKNLDAADQIASTSEAMKKQTLKLIKPSKPIEVTPFGIDTNMFVPKNNKDNSKIVIGIVKSLEETYGIKYLIQSIKLLKDLLNESKNQEISSKIEVLIVGKGSQLSELKRLAKRMSIGDIVKFVGAVPYNEVPHYLNKMDIYCAPSILESFGVAIIEASSCELPVVVTNVGGLPEVVVNNKTGYIVESKNPKHLAERLFELIIDSDKREEFGRNGRNLVLEKYKWDNNVERMEEVYRKLIQKANNRNR